jgi:hypothetical protein
MFSKVIVFAAYSNETQRLHSTITLLMATLNKTYSHKTKLHSLAWKVSMKMLVDMKVYIKQSFDSFDEWFLRNFYAFTVRKNWIFISFTLKTFTTKRSKKYWMIYRYF